MADAADIELDDELEIEVVDDTPDGDKGRPLAPEAAPPEEDVEDDGQSEIPDLGARAKKRIDKLTAERHSERRAKEAAIRERDEAVRLAQESLRQAESLKEQTTQYERGFVAQTRTAADLEIEIASQAYAKAYDLGDSTGMLEANKRLTKAQVSKSQFDAYNLDAPQERQRPQPQPQAQPAAPQMDSAALARQTKFIAENPWMMKDQEMTNAALGVHQQFADSNPHLVGSEEYYDFIKTMMRHKFSEDRFGKTAQAPSEPPRKPAPGVAPVSRGAPGKPGPRKVTLTESQIRLARRLGLTPKQYAEQWIKEQVNG